jgi:hypothetical protein
MHEPDRLEVQEENRGCYRILMPCDCRCFLSPPPAPAAPAALRQRSKPFHPPPPGSEPHHHNHHHAPKPCLPPESYRSTIILLWQRHVHMFDHET